jgi:alkylation response protein AidB-like acyl-CoA dehydrogenase
MHISGHKETSSKDLFMNFDFSDEQQMLRDQARRFLGEKSSPLQVRNILEGDECYDADLWKGMAELGWMGTAVPEEYGGIGLSHVDLCVIAEEIGRALAPVPFSSSVYLATEALLMFGSEEQKRDIVAKLAMGELMGTFALSESNKPASPKNMACEVSNGKISGVKMPVPDGTIADFAIVVAKNGDGIGLYMVDLTGDGVERAEVDTMDPTRGAAKITFNDAAARAVGDSKTSWDDVERVLDRAAILMSFEQIGGADAALEMAVDYAQNRYAFGRPIGSFQAIKHKLADVYVAGQIARSNAYFGAWALSNDAPELPVAAASARVAATDAYRIAAEENVQTHGGMGFTWEFDCHLYYRRSKNLGLAIGSIRRWKDMLVSRLEMRNAAEGSA